MRSWVIAMVISFLMRQLSKWKESLDWAKVKADVAARVRALVPGEWFDDDAVEYTMILLGVIEDVLNKTGELEEILNLVAAAKWQEAWEKLRDLILGNFEPANEKEEAVKQMVADCKAI